MEESNLQYCPVADIPDEARRSIECVVKKLPSQVAQWVEDNILWVVPLQGVLGFAETYYLLDFYQGKHFVVDSDGPMPDASWQLRIVYLAPGLWNESQEKQNYVIAHEIAHHWLRHPLKKQGSSFKTLDFDVREDEADRLAAEWGFPRPGDLGDNKL